MILLSQAEDLSYKYIFYNNRREVGKDEKNNKWSQNISLLLFFSYLLNIRSVK